MRVSLPADGELGDRADRGRLGLLATGVGVDLGVEHQHVDVATRREDVVEAAVADVVGPAVAADDPHRTRRQRVGDLGQRPGVGAGDAGEAVAQLGHGGPAPLQRLVAEARRRQLGGQRLGKLGRADLEERAGVRSAASRPSRMPIPNSALSSNSELLHAGPRPSGPVL